MSTLRKITISLTVFMLCVAIGVAAFTVFFDQAVIVRRKTIYRVKTTDKVVAITLDDGPSPVWTPKILDALKEEGIKATFFMIGEHVFRYPEVARRVREEGHEIGNHSYDHHVLLRYSMDSLEREIKEGERVIREVTGFSTKYFRPPKAWLTSEEKKKVESLGYKVVLWSLNSKDWVTFDDKYIVGYLVANIRPGDIVLFHDSGGVFVTEGGNRSETVKSIHRLVRKLREKGYRFVTITELLGYAKQ